MDDSARATSVDRNAWWFRGFLVGIAALGPFSLNVFSPCLPWIREELHTDLATVQLAATLSILAAAIATIVAGPLADLVGRRPVLLGSLALYVAGGFVAALAPDVGTLVAGRLVQAATSSVAFVTARALIHDLHGDESPRVIARVSLLTVVAVVVAPLLGGALIEQAGWRSVFWTCVGLGAVLGLGAVRIGETRRGPSARPSVGAGLRGVAELLRLPAFHGFAMPSALHFAVFFSFTVTASHLMVERLHEPATGYGLWFVVLSAAVGLGLGTADRLSGRVASAKVALAGSAIAAAGAALSASFLLGGELTAARLFGPVAVSALGIGLAVPGTNAGVMAVRPTLSATASGLMGFEQYVLAAVFAQLVARDAERTAEALGAIGLAGCAGALVFGALALGAPTTTAAATAPQPSS